MPTIHTTQLRPGHIIDSPLYSRGGERITGHERVRITYISNFNNGTADGIQVSTQRLRDGRDITINLNPHTNITVHETL